MNQEEKIKQIEKDMPNMTLEELKEASQYLKQMKQSTSQTKSKPKTLTYSLPGYHKEEENTIPNNYIPPKNNQGFMSIFLILLMTSFTLGALASAIYIYIGLQNITYIL